jgi:acyl-CoA reductase-like NAD-dependent aldehyde dehydrogenase
MWNSLGNFALLIVDRNAPYILGTRAAALPLAAGNSVVLKGSELSPKCFWAIGDAFRQAGLPDGCLNVIYSRPADAPEVTMALVAHPAVKKLTFTGSTITGRKVAHLAAEYIKPVILELGGKAPTVVLEDADLEKAALGATLGSFIHVSATPIDQKGAMLIYKRPVKSACAQNELSCTGLLLIGSAKR